MKKTLLLIGVGGSNALPPETSTQPAVLAVPLISAGQPAPDPDNAAALVKKRVAKAGRDFVRQAVALIENEQRGFYLKLCITFAYILLKIGDKDAYVDEVLAKLNEKHTGVWVPAKTTLQHYEGPMLGWLAKLARQKNPNDPNLPMKFSMTFLREHPRYILDAGDADLKALHTECKTLVKLDRIHGNGCVKPQVLQVGLPAKAIAPVVMTPTAEEIAINLPKKSRGGAKHGLPAQTMEPAVQAAPANNTVSNPPKKKVGRTERKLAQHTKVENQPSLSSSVVEAESALPSNDDLLETIHSIHQTLLAMQNAGVPVQKDVRNALFQCYIAAKEIEEYFRPPPPALSLAA